MSEKITIKEIVFDEIMSFKARRLHTVVTFINNQADKIPEEYRGTATWSMDGLSLGGETRVTIAYRRLETDEENAERDRIAAEETAAIEEERVASLIKIAEDNPDVLQVCPEIVQARRV